MARVGAVQPHREIDHTGPLCRGGVAAECRSGQVRVGKSDIGQFELQLALRMGPGELRRERVETARRLAENPRQNHFRLARIEHHAAARFVAIDVAADSGEPGQLAPGTHAEPVEMPARAVALRLLQRTLPIEVHVGDAALGRGFGQEFAQLLRQGQVLAQQRQRLQLQRIDARLALLGARGVAGAPLQGKPRRRQRHAGLQFQRDLPAADFVAAARALRRQPPLHRAHRQQGQLGRKTRADTAQRDVGSDLLQAFVGKTQPQPQAALSVLNLQRIVEPGAPGREVGVGEFGIEPAVPGLQLLERPALQIAAQVERGGELARRLRPQRETMMAAAIAHDQVQVGQGQQRRAAQLIVPVHLRVADNDFALRQQPVGKTRARVLGIELDAGDIDCARQVPADAQMGLVQDKGMKTQGAECKRVPRHCEGHRGQRQRDAALLIVQTQIGQGEVGAQALPAGIGTADADALVDIARNRLRDEFRMLLDLRQNPEAQRQHHRGKAEIRDQGGNAGEAQQPAHQAAPLRRNAELRQRRKILLGGRGGASFGLVGLHHPEADFPCWSSAFRRKPYNERAH